MKRGIDITTLYLLASSFLSTEYGYGSITSLSSVHRVYTYYRIELRGCREGQLPEWNGKGGRGEEEGKKAPNGPKDDQMEERHDETTTEHVVYSGSGNALDDEARLSRRSDRNADTR